MVAVLLVFISNREVVVASIGATAFIVFAMPKSIAASPHRIIGGHVIGLISGLLVALIPQEPSHCLCPPDQLRVCHDLQASEVAPRLDGLF